MAERTEQGEQEREREDHPKKPIPGDPARPQPATTRDDKVEPADDERKAGHAGGK